MFTSCLVVNKVLRAVDALRQRLTLVILLTTVPLCCISFARSDQKLHNDHSASNKLVSSLMNFS